MARGKKIAASCSVCGKFEASMGTVVSRDRNRLFRGRSFIVKQMRKPGPDVAGFVEMPGHAARAAAHRKCEAMEIGHDRKHALIGDVVAGKDRTATLVMSVVRQCPHAG